MTKSKIILSILLIIPYLLIFKAFFMPGPLVFGDAPYFFPENLAELYWGPLAWDTRTANFGTGQEQTLWLYIPTYIMGLLHFLTGLKADFLIRVVFYFPSTILAITGAYFFAKNYTNGRSAPILAGLFYGFNTYLLILLDGGQIGVALAYGVFPWVILTFKKFYAKNSLKNFFWAVFFFTLITNVDLRVAILSAFAILLILIFEVLLKETTLNPRKLFFFGAIFLVTFFIDAFWLVPFIRAGNLSSHAVNDVSNLNFVSILDAILEFSPHFPENEFGKIVSPPFYFLLLPLLMFGGIILKPLKKTLPFTLSILILFFLAKGGNEPFGQVYTFLISLPFGVSLRDSSKFFIPSLFFSSALIAATFEVINPKKKLKILIFVLVYLYILLLIWPAVAGKMSGVLAGKEFNSNYNAIYEFLKNDQQQFFRTIWFPEKPPLAFSGRNKEALSVKDLYKEIPFASMISGSYDLHNFLYDEMSVDWFKLLGIKYAFFPEDERKKTWKPDELEDRQKFLQFVDQKFKASRLNLGIQIPGYKVSDPNPKIFIQERSVICLGDREIYPFLKKKLENFSLSNQGFIFLEDGISKPEEIFNLPSQSASLIFYNRDRNDMVMTFLQSNFLVEKSLEKSQWGSFGKDQYLDWKFELLQKGIQTFDLAFGKGIYFSTQAKERLVFRSDLKNAGLYRLAFRSISATDSGELKFKMGELENKIKHQNRFSWYISPPQQLDKGVSRIEFENLGGFQALNLVAIIPEEDYQRGLNQAERLTEKFETFDLMNPKDSEGFLSSIATSKFQTIPYQEIDPTRYEIEAGEGKFWLSFSDHFSQNWVIDQVPVKSQPLYSMINGFYIEKPVKGKLILRYKGQEGVDQGEKITIVSLMVLLSGGLVVNLKKLR